MPRLPQPRSDVDEWGGILNEFLGVEHTEDGALRLRSENYISVKDAPFYALGDGVTDDTEAIKAAFDAANAAQKPVFFPPGQYVCSWLYKDFPPRVWGQQGTVTILAKNTNDCTWNFGATRYGAPILLTADFVTGSRTLHLATTGGLREDDLIVVRDTLDGGDSYQAQTLRIYSVDSGTQLTMAEPANVTFVPSAGAIAQPLPPNQRDAYIHGISFRSIVPAASTAGFVRLWYCRNIAIDIDGEGASNPGIILEGCYQFRVKATARRYWDQEVTGLPQFGYGVNISGASAHGSVDVIADQVRHAVSITGPVYDVRITGTASGTTDTAWDAHPTSSNIVFINCHAIGCAEFGFALRGKRQHIHGGLVDNCRGGVYVFGMPGENEIRQVRISRIAHAGEGDGNHGNGILIGNPSAGLVIQGNEIDACARNGISFRAVGVNSNVTIVDNTISNVGQGMFANDRCGIQQVHSALFSDAHISRNIFKDVQLSRTTEYGIQLASPSQHVAINHNEFYNDITPFNGEGMQGAAKIGANLKTHIMAEHVLNLSFAPSLVFDASLASVQYIVLTGNVMASAIHNPTDGQKLTIIIVQDAQGGRTFSWPVALRWPGAIPVPVQHPNAVSVYTFVYIKALQTWIAAGSV
jgi:hypothetical protein